jgi:hypothetical protein
MIKSGIVNLILLLFFNFVFILVAFLSGYASNSSRYTVKLTMIYFSFAVFHLIINFFLSGKMGLKYFTVTSIVILVLYIVAFNLIV